MPSPEFDPLRQPELEAAFQPEGVLAEIAQAGLASQEALQPSEVADVILPPKSPDKPLPPRWVLAKDAPVHIREAANQRSERVLQLATQIGQRQEGSLTAENLSRIDLEAAIWLVEGGANRTSVVRRSLAIDAMRQIYGDEGLEDKTLIQFGGDRAIPRELNGQPNPEYKVAQEIAPDFLPDDDTLTEFKLNVASARQGGYKIAGWAGGASDALFRLKKPGVPTLTLIKPLTDGLSGAFSELVVERRGVDQLDRPNIESLEGKQFVIATNGQYRPKDEEQARQWAATHGVSMLPPVAIGDEAGYTVTHLGKEIRTGERAPIIYVNEMVVLHRLLNRPAE